MNIQKRKLNVGQSAGYFVDIYGNTHWGGTKGADEHRVTYLVLRTAGVDNRTRAVRTNKQKSLSRVRDSCGTLELVDEPIGFLTIFVTVVYVFPETRATVLALVELLRSSTAV